MVLAPLTVREDREAVMDFTYPYFHDAAGAIFKRPGLRRWATLLKPFKWEVLVCLGTVVAGLTLLLYVMENERRKHIAKRQQRKEDDRVAEDSFWYIWGIFLKNGMYAGPNTSVGSVSLSVHYANSTIYAIIQPNLQGSVFTILYSSFVHAIRSEDLHSPMLVVTSN